MPTDKIGLGYKAKDKKESHHEIVELELENIEYEKSYTFFEWISNQDNLESYMLSLENLFSNLVSINIVEIEKIFDWSP